METHTRTILKTITWRIIASAVVFASVYYYSRNLTLAITSGLVSAVIKTILYYLHERVWSNIHFGWDYKKMHKVLKKKNQISRTT